MGTINEAQRLKENEKLFIDQLLKKLLREIEPEIKMVIADPKGNGAGLGFFIFRFVEAKYYDSARAKQIYPLSVTVFVKNHLNGIKEAVP